MEECVDDVDAFVDELARVFFSDSVGDEDDDEDVLASVSFHYHLSTF